MRRYELREDQWLKTDPMLPGKEGDPGRSMETGVWSIARVRPGMDHDW